MSLRSLRYLPDLAALALRLPFAAAAKGGPPEKILFLGYAALGDLVFILPAVAALRRGLPKAKIIFVTDDNLGSRELLPATGLCDEIWRYDHASLARSATRAQFARRVAAENFDAAVVTLAAPVLPFAAGLLKIPVRVGQLWPYALSDLKLAFITGALERRWVFNRPLAVAEEDRHMAARHLELIAALGVAVPKPEEARPELPRTAEADAFAAQTLPPSPARTIAIHLGPADNHYRKMWPLQRWAALANLLTRSRPCRLVLLGGASERLNVAEFRKTYTGPLVDLVGEIPLLNSIAIIRRCDLLLAADTGLAKLALACRVPTGVVWGPTSRRDNGALWDCARHVEITHPDPCPPIVRLGLQRAKPAHDCLAAVTPELAFERLRALLESR